MKRRWPETAKTLTPARIHQLMDRFVNKAILEVGYAGDESKQVHPQLRWRVGWLCVLMREVLVEENVLAEGDLEAGK